MRERVRPARPSAELFDHGTRDCWVEECVTPCDNVHAGEQFLCRRVLEQKAAGAGPKRLVDVIAKTEGREDEDAGRSLAVADPSRCFEAVDAGHADVHQHHIRLQLHRGLDRFEPVSGFRNDLDLWVDLEQLAKSGADERLVVGDDDANAQLATAPRGSRAFTLKPPSLRLPVSSVPP